MTTLVLRCGVPEIELPTPLIDVSAYPTRQELRVLDEATAAALPVDPTPSLEEIAAQPDVAHQGEPQLAPQQPEEELRIIVVGKDAALSAVLTRLMRADTLWASVGYVPVEPSPAARAWGLPSNPKEAFEFALTAPVRPSPLIRNDAGLAVAGSARLSSWDGGTLDAEVIVDDHLLLRPEQQRNTKARFFGHFGVSMVPTANTPGLAAVLMTTPEESYSGHGLRGALGRWMANSLTPAQLQSWYENEALSWLVAEAPVISGGIDERSLATGRALQAGGEGIRVTVDGVSGPRAVKRSTFYRHLRDLQPIRQ